MTDDESRKAFEHNISSPPYELAIDRYPNDAKRHAWPGKYAEYDVQLAWYVWQDAVEWATKRERERCLSIVRRWCVPGKAHFTMTRAIEEGEEP